MKTINQLVVYAIGLATASLSGQLLGAVFYSNMNGVTDFNGNIGDVAATLPGGPAPAYGQAWQIQISGVDVFNSWLLTVPVFKDNDTSAPTITFRLWRNNAQEEIGQYLGSSVPEPAPVFGDASSYAISTVEAIGTGTYWISMSVADSGVAHWYSNFDGNKLFKSCYSTDAVQSESSTWGDYGAAGVALDPAMRLESVPEPPATAWIAALSLLTFIVVRRVKA